MKIKKTSLIFCFLLTIFCSLAIYINDYIYQVYSYEGYVKIENNFRYTVFQVTTLITLFIIAPTNIKTSKNCFIFFYGLLCVTPHLFSGHLSGCKDVFFLGFVYLFLFAPVMFVNATTIPKFKRYFIRKVNLKTLVPFVSLILITSILLIYVKTYKIGSFDFISSYDRRLSGREIFNKRSPIAYSVTIIFNCVAPLLAYLGSLHKKNIFLAIGISISVLAYWSLGIKTSFGLVIIFYIIGKIIFMENSINIPIMFLTILILLEIIVLAEIYINSYSFVGDIFRRLFYVNGQNQFFYFEKFFISSLTDKLYGSWDRINYLDITYQIGSEYYLYDDKNVNTNSFSYFLLKYGLIGYLLSSLLFASTYILLHHEYQRGHKELVSFLSILLSLLICESSLTTVLFSSGIIIIIAYIFITNQKANVK